MVEPVCTNAGYELVDISHTQSPQGWVLRVFIDRPPLPDKVGAEAGAEVGVEAGSEASDREGARAVDPVRQDSSTIGLRDCAQISRELSAILDVEDPLEHAYSLEVSSPGLDRPLRKPSHFQRYIGQVAKVSLRDGLDGRRKFKGTLIALVGDSTEERLDVQVAEAADDPDSESYGESSEPTTLIMNVDGTEYRLSFNDIQNARLVPDWNDLFRRERKR